MLGDASRLRILRLLEREELSVADLQDVLGMGQSRISMQLSQLKSAGLVEVRKSGQKSFYRLADSPQDNPFLRDIFEQSRLEIPEAGHDDAGLELLLSRRRDALRQHFDDLAGKFGRDYVPGRSWKALGELFLRLLPPLEIADLGAGEATLSLLLARRAKRVIAVDNAEKMVEYGGNLARKHGVENLDYRLGDMERLPLEDQSVDLALFHQTLHHAPHPARALREAHRILRPGGRVIVMDLLRHDFEGARELYADLWPGFSQVELLQLLENAGFESVEIALVDRENQAPFFQTLMAFGHK